MPGISDQSTSPQSTADVRLPAQTASPQTGELEPQPKPLQGDADFGQNTTDEQLLQLQSLVSSDPAIVDASKLPVTPVDKLHTTGNPPAVDISSYRLGVDGLVDRPLSLTYDELKSLPSVTETALLICPAFFVDNAQWTGIPVTSLLKSAGIQARANKITFIGLDGYRQILSIDDVQNEGVFLAYSVNGQALPAVQGFPLRLVAKGKYGNIWVKWVQTIRVG